ncbi:hypothetical protein CCP2SC5_190025 [Azospirillaceae bacterium]
MFLVAGDHKGGAKASLIRAAIFSLELFEIVFRLSSGDVLLWTAQSLLQNQKPQRQNSTN